MYIPKQMEDKGMWTQGTIKAGKQVYRYWVKHFEEGSVFGIDEGRISKLQINCEDMVVCSYERGWDVEPADANTKNVLAILLSRFN